MVWLGVVINAVAYLLWAIALKGAKDSAKIANLAYLVPFLSILLSWLVLKEQITIYALFALVLIVGGILLQSINIKRRSKENRSPIDRKLLKGVIMISVRQYKNENLPEMISVWNEVVEDGIAFPQEELLTEKTGTAFFAEQSYCGVAVDDSGEVVGLYILHPNNVGRCGHICNASYAVRTNRRGQHIGEKLVLDCIAQAKELGFSILQFNAVVESNIHARHLYERIGFTQLGVIPKGFRMKDGHFENICPYYIEL